MGTKNTYALETIKINLTSEDIKRLQNYNLDLYIQDVTENGLERTWNSICKFLLGLDSLDGVSFLSVENFGELYEIGLAIQDKIQKKESGQYYTPDDVALLMSKWLDECEGLNICDVACGTGKLILTYLSMVGREKASDLLSNGHIYLYDFDKIALQICKTAILLRYGKDLEPKLNVICGDFLNKDVRLPSNSKVISNPPYAGISSFGDNWEKTDVLLECRDLYGAFFEKIAKESVASVIITPFSFISSTKFTSLREILSNGTGRIYAFDNVPGNIFCGRKHGIFNTNTANSTRAAITVFKCKSEEKGYYVTPLIRFKATERNKLLRAETLDQFLSTKKQYITKTNKRFAKVFKSLEDVYDRWLSFSNGETLKNIQSKCGDYELSMPNTCRYYTTAASGKMNRNGQITLYFDSEDKFNYAYCLISSSFAYWYWRIYDGGITYPRNLLLEMPTFFNKLTPEDKAFFKQITEDMLENSSNFTITKNNVGTQENIKYPRKYRDSLNERFCKIMGLTIDKKEFDVVHSNMALEVNVL